MVKKLLYVIFLAANLFSQDLSNPSSSFPFLQYLESPVYYRDLNEEILEQFVFLSVQDRQEILDFLDSAKAGTPKEFIAFLKKNELYSGLKPFLTFEKRTIELKQLMASKPVMTTRSYVTMKDKSYIIRMKYNYGIENKGFAFLQFAHKSLHIYAGNFFITSPLGIISGQPGFGSAYVHYSSKRNGFLKIKKSFLYNNHGGIVANINENGWNFSLGLMRDNLGLKLLQDSSLSLYSVPWNSGTGEKRWLQYALTNVNKKWKSLETGIHLTVPINNKIMMQESPLDYLRKLNHITQKEVGFYTGMRAGELSLIVESTVNSIREWIIGLGSKWTIKPGWKGEFYLGKSSANYFSIRNYPLFFRGKTTAIDAYALRLISPLFRWRKSRIRITYFSHFWKKKRPYYYGDSTYAYIENEMEAEYRTRDIRIRTIFSSTRKKTRNFSGSMNSIKAIFKQTNEGGDDYELRINYVFPQKPFQRGQGIVLESVLRTSLQNMQYIFKGLFYNLNQISGGVYWGDFSPWKANQWLLLSGEGLKFSLEVLKDIGNWKWYCAMEKTMEVDATDSGFRLGLMIQI